MTTSHLESYGNVWSKLVKGLQTRVNASSFEVAKQCGRKYQYKIVEGRQAREEKVDLSFGTLVHQGLEHYDRARLDGWSHNQAVERTVHFALLMTWDKALRRPMTFDHPQKNRESLVRVLVWYLDKFPKEKDLELYVLADGTPALELPFEFDSGYEYASTGEQVTFIGKLDKMVLLNGKVYIKDRKTTKYSLGARYFANYSPNGQVTQYTLAGQIAFDVDVKGLIIEGIQVGVDWCRFERAIIARPQGVLNEWLREVPYWLGQMEHWAESQYWPMNDASCGLYGGCEFRSVCSMSPEARETWLNEGWTKASGL